MATHPDNPSNYGKARDKQRAEDANADPLTGTPGAHPVGSGVGAVAGGLTGAAAGAATGAAFGTVGGPVGLAAGAIIGGLVGGLIGKGVAEGINPTEEHAYWRGQYQHRSYYDPNVAYDRYAPAYQYGWESYNKYGRTGRGYDEVEPELGQAWNKHRSDSDLSWDHAKHATRDAWDRVKDKLSGDRKK